MPQGTVIELQGDASTTDVKIMLPIADIPDFNPTDATALQAVKVQVFPDYAEIYVGAGIGDLQLPDQELLGDLDTGHGWLQVEKSVLGIEQGQPLPPPFGYHTITYQGSPVLVIEVPQGSQPEPPPEPEPEPIP